MIRVIFLLILTMGLACNQASLIEVKNPQNSPSGVTAMPLATDITIKSITLLAREERMPPKGVIPQPDRDIGFASIFLRLENAKEEDATVKITSIEILNACDGTAQAFNYFPQEIKLGPMEHSEVAFYLTNKTGYLGQDKVKAVVTYQISDIVSVIESELVGIRRF